MVGAVGRTPAVLAVDPVGPIVHAATDRGDRLRIPLTLRADGDRLVVGQAGPADEPADAVTPAPIALWDWIDRPALPVGTALWTVDEALAAMLAAACAQTAAGPDTRRVLVVPATFGAVRRARVAAAAGPGWLLCDSGAAAVLGDRTRPRDRQADPPTPQVVAEDLGGGRVHALVVTDPWTGGADGRRARQVAAPWGRSQISAAAAPLLPPGASVPAPLWSVRTEAPGTTAETGRDLVLRGALHCGERSSPPKGTDPRPPAS